MNIITLEPKDYAALLRCPFAKAMIELDNGEMCLELYATTNPAQLQGVPCLVFAMKRNERTK